MSKQQPSETTRKSPVTKNVESFAKLSLKDQIEAFELHRDILEQSLTQEKANLSSQTIDIQNILEQIKK